jgi:hypothetical protein
MAPVVGDRCCRVAAIRPSALAIVRYCSLDISQRQSYPSSALATGGRVRAQVERLIEIGQPLGIGTGVGTGIATIAIGNAFSKLGSAMVCEQARSRSCASRTWLQSPTVSASTEPTLHRVRIQRRAMALGRADTGSTRRQRGVRNPKVGVERKSVDPPLDA